MFGARLKLSLCYGLSALCFFFLFNVYAQDTKVKEIRNKISEEKRKLEQVQSREISILKELKRFDLRLEELNNDYQNETRKLKQTDGKIKNIEHEIQVTQAKKMALDKQVSAQLKNTYKYGKPKDALAIFDFEDAQWSRRSERVYKLWFDHHYSVLLESEALLKKLDMQNVQLQQEKLQRKKTVAQLAGNKKKIDQQRTEKDALLKRVLGQKSFYQANIIELKKAEKKMNRLMQSLRSGKVVDNSRFAQLKGKLPRPVEGKVFEGYGSYFDKKLNVKLYRKGIRIRAKKNDDVIAIYDGRVAYAGWFDGYGKVIILDHGSGYFSLYAHLDKVFKDKNQMAVVGDVIGFVGDTGTVYGPHLYFELRQKGLTIDPGDWLEK